ncbi:MAG: hypothetical protein ABII25_05125 [bacterium]
MKSIVIPNGGGCHSERSEESVVGAQFIAPRNQGVINHAPTEERFLPSVEMTNCTVEMTIVTTDAMPAGRQEIRNTKYERRGVRYVLFRYAGLFEFFGKKRRA